MKKKIALLLAIIMIVASMPITAFAVGSKTYAYYDYGEYKQTDSSFTIGQDDKVIDPALATDLKMLSGVNKLVLPDNCKLETLYIDGARYSNGMFIKSWSYSDLPNVKNLELSYIREIEEYAFANTGITSVTIPNGIQFVNKHAFDNMPKLESIINQSDSNFVLSIGGVEYVIAPQSTTSIVNRLDKGYIIADNSKPTFSYQLNPVGFNNEDVTFTLVSSGNDALSVSQDGILTGPTQTDASKLFESCTINAKSASFNVMLNVAIEYVNCSRKLNVKLDTTDPYDFVIKEGNIGPDSVVVGDKLVLKADDKYGPILNIDVIALSSNGGSSEWLEYYYSGGTFIIDTKELLYTDLDNVLIDVRRGQFIQDYIGNGVAKNNAKPIDSLPYSNVSVVEKSENRINFSANGQPNFHDVYSYALPADKCISIKLTDVDKFTPLVLGIGVCYPLSDGTEDPIDDVFYDLNNLNITGESAVFYNSYGMDVKLYICPGIKDAIDMGNQYKLEIAEYDIFSGFPDNITVNESGMRFDETTPSVDSQEGKYSWDQATKTLTLKDGFYLNSDVYGILLDPSSTLVVDGNVAIASNDDSIVFYDSQTTSTSNIILNPGSHLHILSGYYGIVNNSKNLNITGNKDANGQLPKITMHTEFDGIYCYTEDIGQPNEADMVNYLSIKDIDFYSLTSDKNILVEDGRAKFEGCNFELNSSYDENIYINDVMTNNVDNLEGQGLEIIDCTIKASSVPDENIRVATGGVSVKNSKLDFYSPNDDSILVDNYGDFYAENSELNLSCDDEGIECDECSVILKDTIYNYKNIGSTETGDYMIMAKKDIVATNNIKVYDANGKLLYEGQLDALKKTLDTRNRDNVILITDAQGNELPFTDIVSSTAKTGTIDDVTVSQLKQSYEIGEPIIIVGEIPDSSYRPGDERIRPVSWEILGTDKKGNYAEDENGVKIPTEGLAEGDYTALITYKADVMLANGEWKSVTDENGDPVVRTREISFHIGKLPVDTDAATPEVDAKSPLTGSDSALAMTCIMTLSLSFALALTLTIKRKKVHNK